jgi:hypothetical protein
MTCPTKQFSAAFIQNLVQYDEDLFLLIKCAAHGIAMKMEKICMLNDILLAELALEQPKRLVFRI